MADKIGARKHSSFKAVCTAPDFCRTPVGDSTPPLPYQIISDLEQSVMTVPNVKFNGRPCYVLDQKVAGAATFGLLALGVEALTTKGAGRIAKVLEEAEKLQKLGKKGKKLASGKDGVKIKKQKFYRSKSERRKALLRDADDPNSPLDQEARDYIKKHDGRKVPEGYQVSHDEPLYTEKTIEGKKSLDVAENMKTIPTKKHKALHKECGNTFHRYPPSKYK